MPQENSPTRKRAKMEGVENPQEAAPGASSADASPPSDEEKMKEMRKLLEDPVDESIDDNSTGEFILRWKIDAARRIIGQEERRVLESWYHFGKHMSWNAKCVIVLSEQCKEGCCCCRKHDPHGPVARFSLWGAPSEAVIHGTSVYDAAPNGYRCNVELDVSLLKADGSLDYICKKKRITFSDEIKSSEYVDDCNWTVDPNLLTDKEFYCINDQVTVQFHFRFISSSGFTRNVRERSKEEKEKDEEETIISTQRTVRVNHKPTTEFIKKNSRRAKIHVTTCNGCAWFS